MNWEHLQKQGRPQKFVEAEAGDGEEDLVTAVL